MALTLDNASAPPASTPEPELLTPVQTARMLSCSVQALACRRARPNNPIPFTKIGSRVYYLRSEILALAHSNLRSSTKGEG